MSDDVSENVLKGVAGELLGVAKASPHMRAAGDHTAKALAIAAETIHTVLLPLAAMNYGARKAKDYFENKFSIDFEPRVADIPPEELVEPKASVAGPALQGLAYSFEENELREMYLALLASAMDGRTAKEAHPAFAEIIRQLSADEVSWLEPLLVASGAAAAVEVRKIRNEDRGFHALRRHLLPMVRSGTAVDDDRLPAWVDNWERLGLVSSTYTEHRADPTAYDWVEKHPTFVGLSRAPIEEGWKVGYEKGLVQVTDFGRSFAKILKLGQPVDDKEPARQDE